MEHKLIQGGEQFLPFARSRVKALRATGLRYASQQFEIDGTRVRVRIEGQHDYIDIEGGAVTVLSGVSKDATLVEVVATDGTKTKYIRSFKPTKNSWDYTIRNKEKKALTSFNDEEGLAPGGDQYQVIVPSMYSGKMATAVQVLMGMGVPITYSCTWTNTNGIVKSTDGKYWLVEISATNGVIAMPFGLAKEGDFKKSKIDAIKECGKQFGGIPSGATFPSADKLPAAILAGTVIRLATVDDMQPFFSKVAYAPWVGWSFLSDAGLAQNTCRDDTGTPSGYLFQLAFNITSGTGASKAYGTATLTLVEQGVLENVTGAGNVPFTFSDSSSATGTIPFRMVTELTAPGTKTPVHVVNDGTSFDVVYVFMQAAGVVNTGNVAGVVDAIGNVAYGRTDTLTLSAYPISTTNSKNANVTFQTNETTNTGTIDWTYGVVPDPRIGHAGEYVDGTITRFGFAGRSSSGQRGQRNGLASMLCRDAYVFFDLGEIGQTNVSTGSSTYSTVLAWPPDATSHTLADGPGYVTTPTYINDNDTTSITLPSGSVITYAPTLATTPKALQRTAWGVPSAALTAAPRYRVVASMLGSSKTEAVFSGGVWSTTLELSSSAALAAETTPSAHKYNFIGYIL